MADFGKESERSRVGLERHVGGSSPRIMAPELVKAAKSYQVFRDHLESTGALTREQAYNIETAFSIAEALSEADDGIIEMEGGSRRTETLVQHIRFWIWKVYHQIPPYDTTRSPVDRKPYDRLFEMIKQCGLEERITVISTNYDILFEALAAENQVAVTYPGSWTHAPSGSGGSGTFAHRSDDEPEGVTVCKLHGSVNFFSSDPRPDEFLVCADLAGPGEKVGESDVAQGRPVVMAVDSLVTLRKEHGRDIRPLIVPPTYAKLPGDAWMAPIWSEALTALRCATRIVFIGYSMPATDGAISALLSGALATRQAGLAAPRLHVVNPGSHERFRETFGTLRIVEEARMDFATAVEDALLRILCS